MADDNAKMGRESLSQFFARILDQLSITSWLPALALVALVLIEAQLAVNDGSFSEAFDSIGKMGVAAIVFLVIGVVIAAMFAQAFEFEAIRLFEGYWPSAGRLARVTAYRRQEHVDRVRRLRSEAVDAAAAAVKSARHPLREARGVGNGAFDSLEAFVLNTEQLDSSSDDDRELAARVVPIWKRFADPQLVAAFDDLERRINEYPVHEFRMLPTRLGNVVRSVEDRVHDPSHGRLELRDPRVGHAAGSDPVRLPRAAPTPRSLLRPGVRLSRCHSSVHRCEPDVLEESPARGGRRSVHDRVPGIRQLSSDRGVRPEVRNSSQRDLGAPGAPVEAATVCLMRGPCDRGL